MQAHIHSADTKAHFQLRWGRKVTKGSHEDGSPNHPTVELGRVSVKFPVYNLCFSFKAWCTGDPGFHLWVQQPWSCSTLPVQEVPSSSGGWSLLSPAPPGEPGIRRLQELPLAHSIVSHWRCKHNRGPGFWSLARTFSKGLYSWLQVVTYCRVIKSIQWI